MDAISPNRGKTKVNVDGVCSPKHFRWTYEMECHFLDLLISEEGLGNRVNGTFTPHAYRNIIGEMQATFGNGIQKNHLKNKIRTLKQSYSEFKDAFRGMSGFAWNWDTKKFEAENEVWEALIQENPSAASLRGKRCLHWNNMETLFSSSRAGGNKSWTPNARCARLDRSRSLSYDAPYQAANFPNNWANCEETGSPSCENATAERPMPNTSSFEPSSCSGKSKNKRKQRTEGANESDAKCLATTMEQLSRAIVESADILANKAPRPSRASDLFNALLSLELPEEYFLECYEVLRKNESQAETYLGATQKFRAAMLKRVMNAP